MIKKQKDKAIKVLLSILICCLFFRSVANEITIDNSFSRINIENQLQCFLTKDSANFQTVINKSFNSKLQDFESFENNQTLWALVNIKNLTNETNSLILRSSKYSSIKLFNSNGNLMAESGICFPIKQRNLGVSALSVLKFNCPPNNNQKLYLALKLKDHIPIEYEKFPISLSKEDVLIEEQKNKSNFLLFFLGGIVLMTLYNLALYFQVRKIHYLYFVLLNFMILMFVLVQTGHIENLLATNYFYHERLIMIVGNLNLVAYTLFSDKILNLQINHPKVFKLKTYLVPTLILLNIPLAFGLLIPVLFGIGSLLALVVYNFVIYASFKAVRRGDSSVSFFFIGNLFFYIGTTLSVLMINEVVPRSILSLTSIEVVELGNLIQLSLFSLSLGAIIKQIEDKLSLTESEKEFAIETANFKDQFLANMSHEIRTPLNGIIGMLDVFYASHELNQKQKEQLGVVKSSSHSLLSIINDILDLSKLQAGKMKISPHNTNINQFVDSIRNLFKPLAEDKGLLLEVYVSEEVPEYVVIDDSRVKQIISNLTSNAIKFTEQGRVTIKIEKKNADLLISVLDTGYGIEDEAKSKIFEEFAQVEESNNRRIDGTGLGLSICTKLVQLMGGEIGVTSEVDKGSMFWFTVAFSEGKSEKPNTTRPTIQQQKETALNILIVEDKPVNQKVAQLMLKKLGHTSELANNGLQCLAKYEENKYHLILMDVQMPEMDGVEAAQRLKQKYDTLPPIIGLSANSMEGDAEKYIELGFDDYLAKPITLDGLKSKIDEYIPQILAQNS